MEFTQSTANYHQLESNALRSISLLCEISGFSQNYAQSSIQGIASTPPAYCSGEVSTVARIIQGYKWTTSPPSLTAAMRVDPSSAQSCLTFPQGGASTTFLSASLLEECVRYLDCHTPASLGLYYAPCLQKECKTLISRDIHIETPIEDFFVPIQNWRLNSHQCPMTGVALLLFLIRRICLGDPNLLGTQYDWTEIVSIALYSYNVYEIPAMINSTILAARQYARLKKAGRENYDSNMPEPRYASKKERTLS